MADIEGRFRAIADKAPVMIWAAGPDKLRTHVNVRWLDFTGRPAQSELGNGWTEGVHPDDRTRCLGAYSESFDRRQEFRIEYRLRRCDREYRWVCDTGVPWFEVDGSFAGYIGVCCDVTDSKLAAEALSRVSGRLIEAHDRECIRIARELHEDIGSSLAILGIELIQAGQPASGGQKHPPLQEIYQKLQEIGSRVSRLSNQLQPPMLKYFGLAKAIETECQEFTKRCQARVSCSCNNVPPNLDPTIAFNLLKVVEEALRNVGKHSRAPGVRVDLNATASELTLAISDDGIGFDVENGRLAGGLGLTMMRERMRLAGGEFEIRSKSGEGSTILCRAPLVLSENQPEQSSRL